MQPNLATASVGVVPALVPQKVGKLSYVPEITEERKPIEITRYVEEQKTRKVPVEVQKMVERTETRRVPYEVKVPKTTITTEKVPYKRTTYKEEVITKKVPYTRSTFKKVETTEPYEVEVPRWVTRTEEVEVPKTVQRKVEYEVMQDVAKVVMMKVPLDVCGNRLSAPSPVSSPAAVKMPSEVEVKPEPKYSVGFGSTLNRRVERSVEPSGSTTSGGFKELTSNSVPRDVDPFGESVLQKTETSAPIVAPSAPRTSGYRGTLTEQQPKLLEETSGRSVVVPDTTPSAQSPGTSLRQLESKSATDFGSSSSSFTERSEDEITSTSQITNRIPRASQWRTEDPFGNSETDRRRFNDNAFDEEWKVDPDYEAGALNKTVIETSLEEVEEPISLPGAAKPDTSFEPGPTTGDEAAADRLFKSELELNNGS